MEGVIVSLDATHHCGYILGENNTTYYFHESVLKNARFEWLYAGQDVLFEEAESNIGTPYAEDVFTLH